MQGARPRYLMLAVMGLAAVMFLVYTLVTVRRGAGGGLEASGKGEGEASAGSASGKPRLVAAAPPSADMSRYQLLIDHNIFQPSGPKPPKEEPRRTVSPPPPLPRNGGTSGPAPRESGPRRPDVSGWTYVGYVILDGETLGIVQNESNRSCQYLAVGDTVLGAEVETVTGEEMLLKAGASKVTLSRNRDFSVVPLDKGPSARPGQPQLRPRGPRR
jgi:hypothetical protein